MRNWAECVANFSEGCDAESLDRLQVAILAGAVDLLDRHADPDHHRSVFTFAGQFPTIRRAVMASAAVAVQEIDLTRHKGAHPRVGAIDVLPLVPLGDTPPSACVEAARDLGERLWRELGVPVYYYGAAALQANRTRLETVRTLGFERLSAVVRGGDVLPDVGGPELHPSAGACCIGVRDAMAAFNVQIAGKDAREARLIARSVREATGGLPGVKALGMYLQSVGVAQVSMNLTKLDQTPVYAAYDAVCAQAARIGAAVLDSELVGLVPRAALGSDPVRLRIKGFNPRMILEERLGDARLRRETSGHPGL